MPSFQLAFSNENESQICHLSLGLSGSFWASRYPREINPPHWMSDKARCQTTDQFTLYRQQEASLNAWQACRRPSPQPLLDKVQMQLMATS